MKSKRKALLALLCAVCLQFGLGLHGFAADSTYIRQWDVKLIEDTLAAELEQACIESAELFGCGIYAVILDDFTVYGTSSYEAAKNIYREQALGVGENKNGILLMLSMSERDYALICYGDIANSVFTDSVQEKIEDAFLDDFAYDDWKGGMMDYVASSVHALAHFDGTVGEAFPGYYKDGVYYPPVDLTWQQVLQTFWWLIGLLSVLSAVCLCRFCVGPYLERKMYTASEAHDAEQYIPHAGVTMTVTEESHSHTERHIIRSTTYVSSFNDDDNNDDRWETTVDSDGFSGRSGKF